MINQKLTLLKNFVACKPLLAAIIGWFTFMWSWMLFTDTLDLAGSHTQGLIAAIFVLLVNVSLSTVILWQGLRLGKWLLNKYPRWILFATLPLLAFIDYLVAWVPAALWIGPQGRLDSLLPLASPALIVINTPLGFASRFIGFFGLAGFVWTIILLLSKRDWRPYALLPAIALALLSFTGWQLYKTPDGVDLKAKIINEQLDKRVPPIHEATSEVVIFPEYGLDNITNDNLADRIEPTQPQEQKTYFIGSMQKIPLSGEVGHLNTMIHGNTTDGITQEQDKYRLIPGGEDLPFIMRTLLRATNQKSTLDYFSFAKGVVKGDKQLEPLRITQDKVIGSAVCSSIIAPQDYRAFTNNGSTVLTNSASLTIFKGSPLFAWQQKSFARFMAVANSRYFLQSANAARAYMLDNNGYTRAETNQVQLLDVTAQTNSQKTFYTLVGDWLVGLGIIVAGISLIRWAPHAEVYQKFTSKNSKHVKRRKR